MTAEPPGAAPSPANQAETHFLRPARRMRRTIFALGIAGAVVAVIVAGPRAGLGFLLGAAVSFLSFWRYERMAARLGESAAGQPPKMKRFVIWFALLAASGYVIVKYLEVNRMAFGVDRDCFAERTRFFSFGLRFSRLSCG